MMPMNAQTGCSTSLFKLSPQWLWKLHNGEKVIDDGETEILKVVL
jgi:hypothetical protein